MKKGCEYKSYNYLDEMKKFDYLINEYSSIDYFTLYVYNKNIRAIKSIEDMEQYIKKGDYLISFSLKSYHNEFFICYDEKFINQEILIKIFKEVCDELGLILECGDLEKENVEV